MVYDQESAFDSGGGFLSNSHNKKYVENGMKHGPFRDSSFLFNMILRKTQQVPCKYGKKLLILNHQTVFFGLFTSVFPGRFVFFASLLPGQESAGDANCFSDLSFKR